MIRSLVEKKKKKNDSMFSILRMLDVLRMDKMAVVFVIYNRLVILVIFFSSFFFLFFFLVK